MPDARRLDDETRRREAEDALRRVKRESAPIGSSLVARQELVAPENGDATDDAVELWGKRIGRGLGGVVIVVLIWQIARTLMAG